MKETPKDKILKFTPDKQAVDLYIKLNTPRIDIVKMYIDKWSVGGYLNDLIENICIHTGELRIVWKSANAFRENSLHAERIWTALKEPAVKHFILDYETLVKDKYGDDVYYQ